MADNVEKRGMTATTTITRRGLLRVGAAGAAVAATALVSRPGDAATPAIGGVRPDGRPSGRRSVVRPGDRRYLELQTGNNQRFVATPDYVHLVHDTAETVVAVQTAVSTGRRVSVRGGGHCFSDFVCNPEIEVIIDTGAMDQIAWDPKLKAFEVGPGARLLEVYEDLSRDWGVILPGGICYGVGIGGHVAGGGYGLLTRSHGLIVDHLHAVEVVTVDRQGKARAVVARRGDTGTRGDLFWAHTGGGGGNFGVVTRYWFRSPSADGSDPSAALPPAPETVFVSTYDIPWADLDETRFKRVLQNFGSWHEQHRDPGTPQSHLSSLFNLSHRAHGSLGVFTQIDASVPAAEQVVTDYNAALLAGTGLVPGSLDRPVGELPAMPGLTTPRRMPWLQASRMVGTNNPTITNPSSRGAHKSAYLKRSFSADQADVIYRQMTLEGFDNPDTMMVMFSFGGQVNAVAEDATANAQRGTAFKICLQTFWQDEADDDYFLGWERDTFEGVFAATGGVPVPGEDADGCYINYPDKDMADPTRNTSGVPWSTLYYKGNYPRLQQAKLSWDPTDFFRHSLSVELPEQTS